MLEGANIVLRALERADLPARVRWVNDDEVRKTLSFDYPASLARTEAWFTKAAPDESRRDFSIFDKATGTLIGLAGLRDIALRHQRAEFYITIGEKEYWGRHLADEVIALLLHYGFVELGLNRIYLYTIPNNDRARKVYERNGFRPEGVLREARFVHGRLQDVYVHGLLRAEWLALRAKLKVVLPLDEAT